MEQEQLRLILIRMIAREHPPAPVVLEHGRIDAGKAFEQHLVGDPAGREGIAAEELDPTGPAHLR
jgi:hypothetical protein